MIHHFNPSINHCSSDCPRRTATCHGTRGDYAEDSRIRESIRQQRQTEALGAYLLERDIKLNRLAIR